MQQCVYETKICDIDDLQKCLLQTWFDFEHNVIEAAIIDQWRDRLRLCICWLRKLWIHAAKLLPTALREAQSAGIYVSYSETDFEGSRPAEATHCTDGGGVKFGTEGLLLRVKFHSHRCNDKGIGPPKLKFFIEIWSKCGI